MNDGDFEDDDIDLDDWDDCGHSDCSLCAEQRLQHQLGAALARVSELEVAISTSAQRHVAETDSPFGKSQIQLSKALQSAPVRLADALKLPERMTPEPKEEIPRLATLGQIQRWIAWLDGGIISATVKEMRETVELRK